MQKVKQFLDYVATHPDVIITYRASGMVIAAHSDASYPSETKARSIVGGPNGAVITISQTIKDVMSSTVEADLGALFINCQEAIPARQALEIIGHKQPPTPMQTDNTYALGVVTNNIIIKRHKSMDMNLHWLLYQISQKQFRHY